MISHFIVDPSHQVHTTPDLVRAKENCAPHSIWQTPCPLSRSMFCGMLQPSLPPRPSFPKSPSPQENTNPDKNKNTHYQLERETHLSKLKGNFLGLMMIFCEFFFINKNSFVYIQGFRPKGCFTMFLIPIGHLVCKECRL